MHAYIVLVIYMQETLVPLVQLVPLVMQALLEKEVSLIIL